MHTGQRNKNIDSDKYNMHIQKIIGIRAQYHRKQIKIKEQS